MCIFFQLEKTLDTDIKVCIIVFHMHPLHLGEYETDNRCLKTADELNEKTKNNQIHNKWQILLYNFSVTLNLFFSLLIRLRSREQFSWLLPLQQCFQKSISNTWQLIRNANFQVPPQFYKSETLGIGLSNQCVKLWRRWKLENGALQFNTVFAAIHKYLLFIHLSIKYLMND